MNEKTIVFDPLGELLKLAEELEKEENKQDETNAERTVMTTYGRMKEGD